MRQANNLVCLSAMLGVAALLVACNGGVGASPTQWDGWDENKGARNDRERPLGEQDHPLDTSESPPDRGASEVPPGGGVGGTLVCSGIYECVLTGDTQSCTTVNNERNCTTSTRVTIRVKIELKEKNGLCTIGEAVLEPNGVLRGDDEDEVGRWSVQGNRLIIQAGASEGYCVPSSGPVGLVGSDDSSREGSGSGSGNGSSSGSDTGNVSVDPGTGETPDGGR